MKNKIFHAFLLIFAFTSLAVHAKTACEISSERLKDSYSYISPEAATALNVCAASKPICFLDIFGHVGSAQTQKGLGPEKYGSEFVGADFVLYQPNKDVCLLAQYSGGSAAAWMFDGWDVRSGKPLEIRKMQKLELNTDGISPSGIVDILRQAYFKKPFGRANGLFH